MSSDQALRIATPAHIQLPCCIANLPLCVICSQSGDALRAAEAAQAGPSTVRNDPWSTRMREKYGLDTTQFSYDPTRAQNQESTSGPAQDSETASSRRCTIM